MMLIDRFADRPGCPGMALSYAPDNEAARALYRSLGFIPSPSWDAREHLLCMTFQSSR